MAIAKTPQARGVPVISAVRHLVIFCGVVPCIFALFAAFLACGWLGSPSPNVWGTSLFSWAARFLLGIILLSFTRPRTRRLGTLRVIGSLSILGFGLFSAFYPQAVNTPLYITPLSSVTLVCLSLASLYLQTGSALALACVPALCLAGMVLNSISLLGYFYQATPLYGGMSGSVGISSALSSLLLGAGFLAVAGPERAPLSLLAGNSISAQLLRAILPATCGAMLLGEIVSDLLRGGGAGDPAVQDALQAFFATGLITVVVLLLARRVGHRLDHAERQRARAEAALSALNDSLAQTIAERTGELRHLNGELREEIAARRHIETALRESEAKNIALISALPDWIFRLRLDGTILDLRCPREQSSMLPPEKSIPSGLCGKVIEWVRDNPGGREHDTVHFRFATEETYEARFVPIGEAQILAVVRDISELARLEREVLEANVREQRRIGEELHDGLGQQLTAVAFMSKVLELELSERNLPEAHQAAQIGQQISACIGGIRALARGLFRYELGSDSLVDALRDLADSVDKNCKVRCTVAADEPISLADRAADLHLLRISQEAITNAVKHGQARSIELSLRREGSRIIFTIKDDGSGSPCVSSKNRGIGLRTMQFRTQRLGGHLGIQSDPGKGTVVTCTLPDPSASDALSAAAPDQLVLF